MDRQGHMQSREDQALCPRLGARPPRNNAWHRRITAESHSRAPGSHGACLLCNLQRERERTTQTPETLSLASHARVTQASACSAVRLKRATRIGSALAHAMGGTWGVGHTPLDVCPFPSTRCPRSFWILCYSASISVSVYKEEATWISVWRVRTAPPRHIRPHIG